MIRRNFKTLVMLYFIYLSFLQFQMAQGPSTKNFQISQQDLSTNIFPPSPWLHPPLTDRFLFQDFVKASGHTKIGISPLQHLFLPWKIFIQEYFSYLKILKELYYVIFLFRFLKTFPSWHLCGIREFLESGRKSWTLDSGSWTLDAGLWMLDSRRWTLDTGLWTQGSGLWTLDAGRWTLDVGLWTLTLDSGLSTLDGGHWTLDATLWTLGSGHWTLLLIVLEQNRKPVSDSAWLNYWKFFGCESLRISWSHLLYREYNFWLGYF